MALRQLRSAKAPRTRLGRLIAAAALVASVVYADFADVSEYDVKAAYLFNFAKFVEWPSDAFRDPSEPISIAVVGDDPFDGALDRTLAGKTIRGRTLVAKRFATAANLEHCHILFIPESEGGRTGEILARVLGTPTLTVGETERFAHDGGMVTLVVERSRVRFDIDLKAARDARLNPSSELLKVARTVRGAAPAPTKEGS